MECRVVAFHVPLADTDSNWHVLPAQPMPMTSMNVSLPEELKEYVELRSRNGYSTPSEYVRELIRSDQKRQAKDKLDSLLLEGLNSGEPIPVDDAFWTSLRQEALARLEARRKAASGQ